uniref:Putative wd repeat protein n=1 Tax=Ornithodoros turicata TaxID=34597 RepID=A0A2R5LBL5_9ACAR
MEDEAAVIYGIEFPARTLTALSAETDTVCFLVGTQSLKFDNQIHFLAYDEETNSLSKSVFLHGAGEVWHLSCSPTDKTLFASCYNEVTQDGKCEMRGAIWKLPDTLPTDHVTPPDDSSTSLPNLEKLTKLDTKKYGKEVCRIIWEPSKGDRIASLVDNNLLLWDLAKSDETATLTGCITVELKGNPKLTCAAWNPHQSCSVIATAVDTAVKAFDLRSMQQVWQIEGAHGQLVREMDFNPNRQYFLATCGDDCLAKFWDVRNPSSPVLVLDDHSHWVWSVRYNHFHDQLVLTSSSDSRVMLSRVASISSEPFGHLVDDEEKPEEQNVAQVCEKDGVIATYEEHEDSVYAVQWSAADPWMFASLSYDGRLVLNRVPRAEKYRVLL